VTTANSSSDKATKLETIYNRIHEIRTRFEIVKRDARSEYCGRSWPARRTGAAQRARCAASPNSTTISPTVAECNIGGEFMARKKLPGSSASPGSPGSARSMTGWAYHGRKSARQPQTRERPARDEHLLADKPVISSSMMEPRSRPTPLGFVVKPPPHKANLGEVYNLSIRYGTLTAEERYHINDHIVQPSSCWSAALPEGLPARPEWAGGHHEKMDGTGYPRGLKRDQMSIPARIMMIADIFEARPRAIALQGAQETVRVHRQSWRG